MHETRDPAVAEAPAPPPLAEVLAATRVVAIPTRTRFRGISVREAAILNAPLGPSEFSPFPEYDDAEAAAWLAAALDFGWAEQPPILRDRIEVNATVPAVRPAEVPGILARFPGCRTAKVKVAERGQTIAEDVARVRAVRAAMGDRALVRVDANGGWSVDEAATALRQLADLDLDYAEQPCATVAELVEVRRRLGARPGSAAGTAHARRAATPRPGAVRIAADESVRKASDPLAVARAGAADLLVVKAQPLGGIRRALGIVAEAGLPVVVSSALDTSAGIAMGLHLAAALPEGALAGACGLGTAALLGGDVTIDPLVPLDGGITVRRPGLDPELLDRYAAPPEREAWWRERITRCYTRLLQ
ncbi:o-succinylbenzoate synthase [Leucobacter triazinivorans]|uniref:o-succinylbenzoate synthase n=1 Tax=Leucobacter triazinivorans TaxID=1784719 RepID=A0A4P6KFZ7_9MICO|nr:o-succinylbenzoate synthase [Leucobacter triazinivorans]QBE49282.1 O-succinylbenzoate synthase [Leucobacter triazinivorans]